MSVDLPLAQQFLTGYHNCGCLCGNGWRERAREGWKGLGVEVGGEDDSKAGPEHLCWQQPQSLPCPVSTPMAAWHHDTTSHNHLLHIFFCGLPLKCVAVAVWQPHHNLIKIYISTLLESPTRHPLSKSILNGVLLGVLLHAFHQILQVCLQSHFPNRLTFPTFHTARLYGVHQAWLPHGYP